MLNSMKNLYTKYKKPLLFLAGALVLSAVLRRSLPLFIYLVTIVALYLPLKGTLARSAVFRIVLSIVGVFCLFQILAAIFWVLSIWVSPIVYILVSIIIIGGAGYWLGRGEKLKAASLTFRRLDVVLLLPCLIIGGVYLTGTLLPAEKDSQTIIRSVTYGMDDATHAVLFADILGNGSNILAGDDRNQLMHKSVNSSYPAGWHVSTSIVAESFFGGKSRTPVQALELYFYAKVLTLMLAIFSLTALIYSMTGRLWPAFNKLLGVLTIFGLSLFGTVVLLLPLFFEGFFSFIPIILYTNLFALLLIDNKNRGGSLLLLALLGAASSLTWMLTGPIFTVVYALYCLNTYGTIRNIPIKAYAGLAVSGLSMLAQAYILYSANRNSIGNVSAEGGITSPEHLLLLAGITAFFVLYIKNTKAHSEVAKPLLGFVIVYLAVLAVLLLYLTTVTSEITYYYTKLQMPLLVVLFSMLVVYVFGILFNTVRTAKFTEQATLFVAGFALLSISIPSLIGYDYVYNTINRAHAYVLTSAEATLLDTSLSNPSSNTNDRILYMFPGQPSRNILASNVDKMCYKSTQCDYRLFAAVYAYDTAELSKVLQDCAPLLPLVQIYTNEEGKKQILENLDLLLIDHREVSIVVV